MTLVIVGVARCGPKVTPLTPRSGAARHEAEAPQEPQMCAAWVDRVETPVHSL